MTLEEIKVLDLDSIETRKLEISEAIEKATAEDIDSLDVELRALEERKKEIAQEIEQRKADMAEVINGIDSIVVDKIEERKGEMTMTNLEVRNTQEYIEAFAKYVRTGKDMECRALLTENVNGTVPVPSFVESTIRNAWENDEIFRRVKKTFVKGNLRVGFELSATDAGIHTEGVTSGTGFVAEEELVLGIVEMVPQNIKKWITVSDEVLALGATDFLDYLYDELTHKIIEKAASIVISKIANAPATSDNDSIGVPVVSGLVTMANLVNAIALLGSNAQNRVVVASGATLAALRIEALNNNYAVDPFQGLTPIQNDNVTGAIVGDLSAVQANLPEGDTVHFKFDDLSLAEKDLVKIVGRMYAAIELTGPKMLAKVSGSNG